MDKNVKIEIAVGIILIIAVIIGGFVWLGQKEKVTPPANQPTVGMVCTQEAKLCSDGKTYVSRTGSNCEFAACPDVAVGSGKIVISAPIASAEITSPVTIAGQARGTWFSEGVFPVEVHDSNDKLLGSGQGNFAPKNATDTWMTEDFVDFKGEIKFSQPTTASGYLLFKKDNPSGNPAMDESVKVAIRFKQGAAEADWHTYTNAQYGFQLTFPDTWKGYLTKHRTLDWGSDGKSDSIDFGFPAQDGLFNISFHTQKQYDAISSSGAPFGVKLGESKGFVIVGDQAQFAEDSMKARYAEISSIIKTFKIIK